MKGLRGRQNNEEDRIRVHAQRRVGRLIKVLKPERHRGKRTLYEDQRHSRKWRGPSTLEVPITERIRRNIPT